jgi:hypothetical protein
MCFSACGVNREHDTAGLARTNADKRQAVTTLLGLPGWKEQSSTKIAAHCGVSQTFVSQLKNQVSTVLISNGSPQKVTGKDGNRYPSKHRPKVEESADSYTEPEQEADASEI